MNKKTLFLAFTLLTSHAPLIHCMDNKQQPNKNNDDTKKQLNEINKTQKEQTETLNEILENQKPWYKKLSEKISKKYNNFKNPKSKKAAIWNIITTNPWVKYPLIIAGTGLALAAGTIMYKSGQLHNLNKELGEAKIVEDFLYLEPKKQTDELQKYLENPTILKKLVGLLGVDWWLENWWLERNINNDHIKAKITNTKTILHWLTFGLLGR